MEVLNQPVVKMILTILAFANATVIAYPGLPPWVKVICGVLAAVLTGLGYTAQTQLGKELKGARAENLALQQKLRGVP